MIRPYGLVLTSSKDILDTCWLSNSVILFSFTGEYIRHFGDSGSKQSQFDRPTGIAICHNNSDLLVCDLNNHRMQAYNREFEFFDSIAFVYYPQDVDYIKIIF